MSDFIIDNDTLVRYTGSGGNVVIPNGVKRIGNKVFRGCIWLTNVIIPDSVKKIEGRAFEGCVCLSSVNIPEGVTEIGFMAFSCCTSLISVTIPASVTEIGFMAFYGCTSLTNVIMPDDVAEIGNYAFYDCPNLTVFCYKNSLAHQYCLKNHISFLFSYRRKSFHETNLHGREMPVPPFFVDEEMPYVFIGYSHKDRDAVLPILKILYEAGWKIWYDEGLTIDNSYDQILENHVANCSAFLLFVTSNSIASRHIREHEIPLAKRYEKPIIKCILEEGEDYPLTDAHVIDTVAPEDIESTLEKAFEFIKGKETRSDKYNRGYESCCSRQLSKRRQGHAMSSSQRIEGRRENCLARRQRRRCYRY